MVNDSITTALRLLGRFWLEELTAADLETVEGLSPLAETLPDDRTGLLTGLAVEFQRLFGFNLPPYESTFVDPSGMLMAPATERVQALYRQGGWQTPPGVRAGAPDHLGLELMAWADWLAAARETAEKIDLRKGELAGRLHTRHLVLWVPAFVLAFQRLKPQPFYHTLSELTLDLLLAMLPEDPIPAGEDPFPDLPDDSVEEQRAEEAVEKEPLRPLVKRLLLPRAAGLYLTREDIAQAGQAVGLPATLGDRYQMLTALFRAAAQYDLRPRLVAQLIRCWAEAEAAYERLAVEYPAWTVYAQAWRRRLAETRTRLQNF